jgi:4'-phosphopantetheinyl transferase EntD
MMNELLPSCAVAAERWNDEEAAFLFPEERAQHASAIEGRVREFASGRSCAREALGKLGFPPCPILRGSRGEPLWPHGVIGSITHCAGYRAAAVAMQTQLTAIGIDAEIHDSLPEGIAKRTGIAQETAGLFHESDQVHWDTVLFSAKESVYKAWFPLTQRWLDFEDVAITVDAPEGSFRVRPLVSLPSDLDEVIRQFSGHFLVRNGIVMTSVVLPRREE